MKKTLILFTLLVPVLCFAQALGDYLILNDIGEYKYRPKRTREIYGNSGVLIPAGHFDLDHNDTTYESTYIHPVTILGVEVQVTKHADSPDSIKWLLHEMERAFQKPEALGSAYAAKNPVKDINSNRIFYMWRLYRWISNNVVVSIEASDPQGLKPEPTEVVQAYLQKFPSTMPSTLVLDDAHKIQWIKDEMDRRLWLCDKWFMQLQLQKVQQTDAFQAAVKSMNIFLDYREKYYGIKAVDEKNLLAGYLSSNNGTSIKAKLTEYKSWWSIHKTDAISLP